ncbi:hypothetical protein CXR34_09030 [Microbacterium hominis]|uniref:Uracil-DNA glycosylase-like domain-containing protein n=2 Tax=Microbacteriaceae TaxID=85023 RepID=A0A2K9DC36_9MICO|nr:hypothetical protein CXR34_09030 [Microbacterium hominis]
MIVDRLAMLESESAVQPLREWARSLSERSGELVPQFDPAEAGVDAKLLFLQEAPGPMTNAGSRRRGSGFISVDNNDATAEAVWRARDAAGLHDGFLAWNIVPWYLGAASRKPTAREVAEGAQATLELLSLLPYLEVVALAGRYAQAGWQRHIAPVVGEDVVTVNVWHPSPLSLNQPGRRAAFNSSMVGLSGVLRES